MPDAYIITDDAGNAVSVGTIVADPLPDGLTAHQFSDATASGLLDGSLVWDAATMHPVARPVVADTRSELIEQAAQATTVDELRAALLGALDAQML